MLLPCALGNLDDFGALELFQHLDPVDLDLDLAKVSSARRSEEIAFRRRSWAFRSTLPETRQDAYDMHNTHTHICMYVYV